ncbi:kinase-like protein [Thelephora ganbajun]|uniref:Kinase-like protein n=1 Tax=Thelephora ganbajun TaxID=370292 RepID=A0ACB6ZQQ7_THEGA|nr:kinase-like protein [Thelephora ganbajun]
MRTQHLPRSPHYSFSHTSRFSSLPFMMSSSSASTPIHSRPAVEYRSASELSGTTAVSGRLLRTHDFVVVRGLGVGKFGTVFLVDDVVTERRFAMKVVPKRIKHQAQLARREFETLLNVSNTKWCSPLRGCFQDSENVYFLLDYFAAGDLHTQLERAGSLSDHQKKVLIAEMIVAVEELHSLNIIHRDIKPGNLLVSDDGHIVLADFGMSRDFNAEPAHYVRAAPRASPFESVMECGTPYYMSPDVWQGNPYSFEVDLWAIAVCLHELFLGRLPFNMDACYGHEDIKTFVCEEDFTFGFYDHVSMDLWDILDKMFRKDRNARLTIEKLKVHGFFNGIDWDRLARRELPPPLQPKIVLPEKEYDSDIVFSKIPLYEGDDPFHYVDKSLEDFSASPDLPSPLPLTGTVPCLSPSLPSSTPSSSIELLEILSLSPPRPASPSFDTSLEVVELPLAKSCRSFPVLRVPAPYAPSLEVEEPPPAHPAPTPNATDVGSSPLDVALACLLDGYRQMWCQLCL